MEGLTTPGVPTAAPADRAVPLTDDDRALLDELTEHSWTGLSPAFWVLAHGVAAAFIGGLLYLTPPDARASLAPGLGLAVVAGNGLFFWLRARRRGERQDQTETHKLHRAGHCGGLSWARDRLLYTIDGETVAVRPTLYAPKEPAGFVSWGLRIENAQTCVGEPITLDRSRGAEWLLALDFPALPPAQRQERRAVAPRSRRQRAWEWLLPALVLGALGVGITWLNPDDARWVWPALTIVMGAMLALMQVPGEKRVITEVRGPVTEVIQASWIEYEEKKPVRVQGHWARVAGLLLAAPPHARVGTQARVRYTRPAGRPWPRQVLDFETLPCAPFTPSAG